MRSDTSQNTLVESLNVDREHEPGNTTQTEDSVLDNIPSKMPLRPVTDGSDDVAQEEQSPILLSKPAQEFLDIKTETDYEHICTPTENICDHIILPAIPKGYSSRCPVDPDGESNTPMHSNDAEGPTVVYPQDSPLLRASTVFPSTPLQDIREPDPVDRLNSTQVLHTDAQIAGFTCLGDDKTREDFDYPCENFSLPPSSSPPQLFSSSPRASSQSSVSDLEPSKMVLADEAEGCTSSHECVRNHRAELGTQDDLRLESEELHNRGTTEVAPSQETDQCCSQMSPTSDVGGNHELFRKRIADPDESHGSQPTKRPNLDSSCPYLPPAPKRATIASQRHQFKKLTAPFRPPLKLPVVTHVMDGSAHTMNNKKVGSTTGAMLETSHDDIHQKGSTVSSQHTAPNASRSLTQFRSPLVKGALSADSRTIRLTPALQTLERKLQLLKRAIKVKEDNEEEVLTRLAEKWIEAGREVAYDVWDALKDIGDLAGKVAFSRRSDDTTKDGNMPWGWDTKPRDASEESCDSEPSDAPCATGRLVPEEDDAGCNTLGNMLRQLGIAQEIFGWDNEKEAFSD